MPLYRQQASMQIAIDGWRLRRKSSAMPRRKEVGVQRKFRVTRMQTLATLTCGQGRRQAERDGQQVCLCVGAFGMCVCPTTYVPVYALGE